MSRKDLLSGFRPSAGIEDPHQFAGRSDQLRALTDALHEDGSVPLIYGERGLGKSSLALQMSRIAKGDVYLLQEHELGHLALDEESRFVALFLSCSDSTRNLNGLLRAMVTELEGVQFELDRERSDKYKLVDRTKKRELSLKVFKAETSSKYEVAVKERNLGTMSIENKVVYLSERITEITGQPVLFIVDELDRVSHMKGLASFLKSRSSEILKFMFVGIAASQEELISDHASLKRQLHPVKVPLMNRADLEDIITRAEEFLHGREIFVEFDAVAKTEIAKLAGGYPWFVHVIGQTALLAADDESRGSIERINVARAVESLVDGKFADHFSHLYHKAVRDSSHRETVLRLFALWRDHEIPTSTIYPRAKDMGVANPSTWLKHLTTSEFGKVLRKSSFQNRASYRFSDEMFKVYVRMAPSIFEGVKRDTEIAMRL